MSEKLYLVDGHGLIFRAYYAFINRPLLTSSGENTSALFGFMRMLLRLLADENPEHLVCVFDAPGKTFRYTMYNEYKAKRLKAPEDLHAQVSHIKNVLDGLGVPRLELEGYEADDLIGALAHQAGRQGMRTVVFSSDKDILQLVNENTVVYASKKGISEVKVMDRAAVREEWGIEPEQVADFLALTGDQSDNIPGVKGIGKTSARKLLSEWGSLDEMYSNLHSVQPERMARLLEQGRENAALSKQLVSLRLDAPVQVNLEEFRLDCFPRREGIALLAERELNTLVSELSALLGEEVETAAAVEHKRGDYQVVKNLSQWQALEKRIRSAGRCAVDTECTSKDCMTGRLIGLSFALQEGEGWYVPIASRELSLGTGFLEHVKPLLEDAEIGKVGQNIKYDYVLLNRCGIDMKGITGDSMIAGYLLDPVKQRYSLDDLAQDQLSYCTIRYEDVVKDKQCTLLDYPLEKVAEYAAEDADITLRLVNVLEPQLQKAGLENLYRNVELPLLSVLGRMELRGVLVDRGYLDDMSRRFEEEIRGIEKDIHDMAEEEFNIRSTKQLGYILFDKMGLPVIKKTKTGYSTDESVLEELAKEYKIAVLLLRHRKLTKLKSTYVDALPALINPDTGRIHTSFHQTIAATGRLSSSRPNLQNIPIREQEGKAIRSAFVPPGGWSLVSADYSQIELRILASLSADRILTDSFCSGLDIHCQTASLMFGLPDDQVEDHHRRVAKTINFSVIYGISPFGLSRRLGVSRSEAGEFIARYFQRYQGVKSYFQRVVEQAKACGYVETLLGRRRIIPHINSGNRNLFEAARRMAINTPVQGTAADLIKTAMVRIDREIAARSMRSRMLIQVHDELVFESPDDEVAELENLVKEVMEGAITFDVPIVVNIEHGENWGKVH